MGIHDKASNKAEEFGGKAKEAVGRFTGDRGLENEGKADQTSSALKQGVEAVKDKAHAIKDTLTGR